MLRGLGVPLGIGTTLRFFLIGMFFNQTLPSSIGGDAPRVFYLWRAGTDAQTALNSVLLDRILGLSILVIVTTLVAPTNMLVFHSLIMILSSAAFCRTSIARHINVCTRIMYASVNAAVNIASSRPKDRLA